MNRNKTFILLTLLGSMCFVVGCQNNSDPLKNECDHTFVLVPKEEFEETSGHDAYYTCSQCNDLFDLEYKKIDSIPVIPATRKILLLNKYNGSAKNVLSETVKTYLSLEDESKIASMLQNNTSHNETTNGVSFTWSDNGSSKYYRIQVSSKEDFSTLEVDKNLNKNTFCVLYNLVPGKKYYRIVDKNNTSITSVTDSFELTDTVRTIKTDSVVNMRDIGGWPTLTGDKVKYSLLYRSAVPSSNDLSLFYNLGIKTELDLRICKADEKDEIGNFNGVDSSNTLVKYVKGLEDGVRFWPQYDYIFDTRAKPYMKKIFNLLSNETNYPIDFHCQSGADRTGTLAYIINGLCGVGYEDLVKDYELTTFYKSNRFRSKINFENGAYSFDPSGDMGIAGEHYAFGLLHSTMMTTYGKNGKTLQEAIFDYLVNYCEIEEATIKSMLSILLEGNNYLNLFND